MASLLALDKWGFRERTQMNVLARCFTNVHGDCVFALRSSSSAVFPSLGGRMGQVSCRSKQHRLFPPLGRRWQLGKLCQAASSLKTCPICGHYFTCVYSKGSFFLCKWEPVCHLRSGILCSLSCPSHIWRLAGCTSTPRPFLVSICNPASLMPSNLSITFSQVSCWFNQLARTVSDCYELCLVKTWVDRDLVKSKSHAKRTKPPSAALMLESLSSS